MSLSKPITSAIHGISKSAIYFLISLSGSLTNMQIRVSYFFELNGCGIIHCKGLGEGFSGSKFSVNVKCKYESSSWSNYYF